MTLLVLNALSIMGNNVYCNGKYKIGLNVSSAQFRMLLLLKLELTKFKGHSGQIIIQDSDAKRKDFNMFMEICEKDFDMEYMLREVKTIEDGTYGIFKFNQFLPWNKKVYEFVIFPRRSISKAVEKACEYTDKHLIPQSS